MGDFTHFDLQGNAVMVDVSGKSDTAREAVASGRILMSQECFHLVKGGGVKKGDVLGVARIAGIMGAKKTSELIPLCHIIGLTGVEIEFELRPEICAVEARCTARTVGRTGVEMEALTGVNIALLTIYDMCKAVDKGMFIESVHLVQKSGGKSGTWTAGEEEASGSLKLWGEKKEPPCRNRKGDPGDVSLWDMNK